MNEEIQVCKEEETSWPITSERTMYRNFKYQPLRKWKVYFYKRHCEYKVVRKITTSHNNSCNLTRTRLILLKTVI